MVCLPFGKRQTVVPSTSVSCSKNHVAWAQQRDGAGTVLGPYLTPGARPGGALPACMCPYVYIPVQMKQKHFPLFFFLNCIKAESCMHVGLTSALLVSLTLRETSAWGGWLAGPCSPFPGELSFSSCYQKISWQTQTWRLAAPDQSCKRVILQMFWHVFVCVYIYKFIYKNLEKKNTLKLFLLLEILKVSVPQKDKTWSGYFFFFWSLFLFFLPPSRGSSRVVLSCLGVGGRTVSPLSHWVLANSQGQAGMLQPRRWPEGTCRTTPIAFPPPLIFFLVLFSFVILEFIFYDFFFDSETHFIYLMYTAELGEKGSYLGFFLCVYYVNCSVYTSGIIAWYKAVPA